MIKNKALWAYTCLSLVLAAIGTLLLWNINPQSGLIALVMCSLLICLFLLFTYKRYRDLKQLSEYLASVYYGQPSLDIRDNTEGELSILKNDLYKVTLTLSEQSALLLKDKLYLAETLSNISHQLKTPLTSMFMMTDLLSNPELAQDKRELFLSKIMNQLKRIEWLVSALLKLSKIDAQAVTFKQESVLVQDLLRQAIEPLQIPLEVKRQHLLLSGADTTQILADKSWTAEALLNIIKNCIEHTPVDGEIRIACTDTPLYTQIIISDNGEGIAPEDVPHIFERFYKGKNAGPDSVGIGLAMTKTILQSQNADVYLDSQLGQGTTFTVKFFK